MNVKYEKWTGFDFDNTLVDINGDAYPEMVTLVNELLDKGEKVKIFTARVVGDYNLDEVKDFCKEHFGQELEITNEKDPGMEVLYDDRVIQVKDGKPMLQGIGHVASTMKERVKGLGAKRKKSPLMQSIGKFSKRLQGTKKSLGNVQSYRRASMMD